MDLKAKIGTLVAGSIIAVAGFGAMSSAAYAETNVTASNSCEDCETETGDSSSQNNSASFTGQNAGPGGVNVQEGDNESEVTQDAQAESGDGVNGQVAGVVDDGSGDVNMNLSNSCVDCSTTTGDANAQNNAIGFVGLNAIGGVNVQDGDNESSVDQGSYASSGDGISGQIVGLVTI